MGNVTLVSCAFVWRARGAEQRKKLRLADNLGCHWKQARREIWPGWLRKGTLGKVISKGGLLVSPATISPVIQSFILKH